MNPRMSRWIMASCRTWFNAKKDPDLTIFWEYTRHKKVDGKQSYAEFRLDGPDFRQVTSNEQWYDVELNVLLTQTLNEGNSEEMELLIARILPCFTPIIPVYKYGLVADTANDNTLIGCLQSVKSRDGEIEVSRFGQANPDTLFTQSSVESKYRLKLLGTV